MQNNICRDCFEATIPSCANTINVVANLEPNTQYSLSILTALNKVYGNTITTDSNGNFSLDLSILPVGYSIPQSGLFILSVKKDALQCGNDTMQFCLDGIKKPFTCIAFSFIDTQIPINQIGCIC